MKTGKRIQLSIALAAALTAAVILSWKIPGVLRNASGTANPTAGDASQRPSVETPRRRAFPGREKYGRRKSLKSLEIAADAEGENGSGESFSDSQIPRTPRTGLAIVAAGASSNEAEWKTSGGKSEAQLKFGKFPSGLPLDSHGRPLYRPREILVVFKDSVKAEQAERICAEFGCGIEQKPPFSRRSAMRVILPPGMSVREALDMFSNDNRVVRAEANAMVYAALTPNDPRFGDQWGLHNTGQSVDGYTGTPDADMDAPEAWDLETGSVNVIVAVLDSGVNTSHPELAGRCLPGYDFVDDDNVPEDYDGHGTLVAGIIAAAGNDAVGVAGVCWSCRILPVRLLDELGYGDVADLADAIDYAVSHGADIINMSLAGYEKSSTLQAAVQRARDAGVLIVCAAGNDNSNNDQTPIYPANLSTDFDNVITVAASNARDKPAWFTNFGVQSVNVFAPGVNICVIDSREELFYEDFNGVTSGEVGAKFTETGDGTWGVVKGGGDGVLYSDTAYPYQGSVSSTVTSIPIDTSAREEIILAFLAHLDTADPADRVYVEAYTGSEWAQLDFLTGHKDMEAYSYDVTAYAAADFRFRFRWVTDAGDDPYDAVWIDEVRITCKSTTTYRYADGTSMAAPNVAGVAALVKSRYPAATAAGIRKAVEQAVDWKSDLAGYCSTGGRVNAFTAVQDDTPPEGLSLVAPAAGGSVYSGIPTFRWSEADFDLCGPDSTSAYRLELSASPAFTTHLADVAFSSADTTSWTLSGTTPLMIGGVYYWKVTATDSQGQASTAGPAAFTVLKKKKKSGGCRLFLEPGPGRDLPAFAWVSLLAVLAVLKSTRRRKTIPVRMTS